MAFQTFLEWMSQADHPWATTAKQNGFESNGDHRMAGALVQSYTRKGGAELHLISSSGGQHKFVLVLPGGKEIEGDSEPKLRGACLRLNHI